MQFCSKFAEFYQNFEKIFELRPIYPPPLRTKFQKFFSSKGGENNKNYTDADPPIECDGISCAS